VKYLSVCSGIEAASCAWESLGWEAVGFSEIEPFPSAVLAHRYPGVKNYGDMTKYKEWNDVGKFDVLVGGTPCQSFSIAGLRKGLDDPRGNLMLVYGAMADHFKPAWIVWENVPGVLSSNGGRDFGSFLGMLGQLGYGVAYRVLDAQYFGVPQRRRRVFVVGYLGDWRRAASVLFESHSLQGNIAPVREKREKASRDVAACLRSGGNGGVPSSRGEHLVSAQCFEPRGTDSISKCLTKGCAQRLDSETETFVTYEKPVSSTVRRLTPKECERLQGFPDDWTLIPWRGKIATDGPRYKACGNSMAVPVMKWIGERINGFDTQSKRV